MEKCPRCHGKKEIAVTCVICGGEGGWYDVHPVSKEVIRRRCPRYVKGKMIVICPRCMGKGRIG